MHKHNRFETIRFSFICLKQLFFIFVGQIRSFETNIANLRQSFKQTGVFYIFAFGHIEPFPQRSNCHEDADEDINKNNNEDFVDILD